jgi:hypothetical protein
MRERSIDGRSPTLADLTDHETVLYRFVKSGTLHRWDFTVDGHKVMVDVRGRLTRWGKGDTLTSIRPHVNCCRVDCYSARFFQGESVSNAKQIASHRTGFVVSDSAEIPYRM